MASLTPSPEKPAACRTPPTEAKLFNTHDSQINNNSRALNDRPAPGRCGEQDRERVDSFKLAALSGLDDLPDPIALCEEYPDTVIPLISVPSSIGQNAIRPDLNDAEGDYERTKNMADTLWTRFQQLEGAEDLDMAIYWNLRVRDHAASEAYDRTERAKILGALFLCRADRLGQPDDIYKAVENCAWSIAMALDNCPDKPERLNNLGNAHQLLYERLGELEHLRSALTCKAEAVALTPDGHLDKPFYLNNLGDAHQSLFERLGELEDLHQAAGCFMRSVTLIPDGHPNKPGCLNNLGVAYQSLFEHLGKLDYMHKALGHKMRAVTLTPDSHPAKPMYLTNLGNAYQYLFEGFGEHEHIQNALRYQTQAVALTPDGHPDKPGRLNNLGNAHQLLFERLGQLKHMHSALDYKTQTVTQTPDDHPSKPIYLNNLGNAYELVFKRLGKLEHLRSALGYKARAVALSPNNHPNKPVYLSNLGNVHQSLFQRLGQPEDLRSAAHCFMQALALTPDGHPQKTSYLASLGSAYLLLYTASDKPEHIVKSKKYLQSAALSRTGHPFLRFHASWVWALLPTLEASERLEAYSSCMTLLPQAVWLGTSIHRRYESLASEVRDRVSGGVITALLANRYDLFIEWLEQGRCLVWSQMLQLRTPLDNLQASHPDLAVQIQYLSSQLESRDDSDHEGRLTSQHERSLLNTTHKYIQLADKRDKLVDNIRLLPGFDDFLRPPTVSKLIGHVQLGAAVILNVHKSRCDAAIIKAKSQDISHIPLTNFSYEKATNTRVQLDLCLRTRGTHRKVVYGDDEHQISFKDMLSTLWYDVVRPVVTLLGINHISDVDNLPHITWCITGPLSFLPIHAAGDYDAGPESILSNLVVSSYTPNITSMGKASLASPGFSGILTVGHQSSIRDMGELPGTKTELDEIEQQFQDYKCTRLDNEAACTEAVLHAMEEHSWVHFACHASQSPGDPLESALHLHDGSLNLAKISKHPIKNAQLAFLSACETATGDSILPDEAVHLAAGLLMAGYSDVIATMWAISDTDAPIVAGKVYEYLLKDGVPDSRNAAKALHVAVKHLKDAIGTDSFERWVPYIHIGG